MLNLKALLNKPCRFKGTKNQILKEIIGVSVFVPLFFILFEPFNIRYPLGNYNYLLLAGLFIPCFFTGLLYYCFIYMRPLKFFHTDNWTLKKDLLTNFLVYIIGSNFIYGYIYFITDALTFSIITYLNFYIYIALIGAIVYAFINVWHRFLYLAMVDKINSNEQNLRELDQSLNDSSSKTIFAEKKNEKIQVKDILINPNSIYHIASMGNYILIYYSDQCKIKKQMIRCTLKDIENIFAEYTFIYKCHRSHIINLKKLSEFSGNKRGLRIKLRGYESEVPVSRNKIEEFSLISNELNKEILNIN